MESIELNGVRLHLAHPITKSVKWIGMKEHITDILACWTTLNDQDLPMHPRLLGKPGTGKTSLAIAAGQAIKQDVYIFQCTMDTRPEDLLITPFLKSDNQLAYFASPIVSAMIKGGVVILDEGNRMNEKSWASLASLLDYRRSIESSLTGLKIEANNRFRCCVTMNEDASTYEIPDYIASRLQPKINIDFPSREEETEILKYHVDFAPEKLLRLCVNYLQKAHELDLDFSTRDGIHLINYTIKSLKANQADDIEAYFHRSIERIISKEAIDLEKFAEKRKINVPYEYFNYENYQSGAGNLFDHFQNLSDFLKDHDDDTDNDE